MKTYRQFIFECYYIQEDPGDAFANMSDDDFERYKKSQPSTAAFAEKKRKEAQARRQNAQSKTPKSGTQTRPNQSNQSTQTQSSQSTSSSNSSKSSRRQDIYDRFKKARDSVKNTASSAYNTSPRDAVNSAKNVANNVKNSAKNAVNTAKSKVKNAASAAYNTSPKDVANAVKSKVSDVKTEIKYGRTIKPDTSGTSSITKAVPGLAKYSKGASALRAAGKLVGPASAALDVASEKSKGSGWARSLAKGAVTAAGGALGGAAGSVAGPVGTVAGGAGGAAAASKAFDVAAGKNAKERAADRLKNRQRQAGGALVGTAGKTTFDTKKNTITTGGKTAQLGKTSVVNDPKTGKQETGYLAYKGGKAVYKRADKPGTGSSNAFERIGRAINPNAYKANDAKLAAQKLNTAKQSDAARNKALGVKPK